MSKPLDQYTSQELKAALRILRDKDAVHVFAKEIESLIPSLVKLSEKSKLLVGLYPESQFHRSTFSSASSAAYSLSQEVDQALADADKLLNPKAPDPAEVNEKLRGC